MISAYFHPPGYTNWDICPTLGGDGGWIWSSAGQPTGPLPQSGSVRDPIIRSLSELLRHLQLPELSSLVTLSRRETFIIRIRHASTESRPRAGRCIFCSLRSSLISFRTAIRPLYPAVPGCTSSGPIRTNHLLDSDLRERIAPAKKDRPPAGR